MFFRCNVLSVNPFLLFRKDAFQVVLSCDSYIEVAFKVKYTDVKGTEKDYQIKSNEGDNLLETIKMAGIPIRCYFFMLSSFLATCNGNCVCRTCAVKFSPALHDQIMQSSKEAGLLRRKGKDGNGYFILKISYLEHILLARLLFVV